MRAQIRSLHVYSGHADVEGLVAWAKVACEAGGKPRIAPATVAQPDWHNGQAAFLLDLDGRLEAARSEAERRALIDTLRGAQSAKAPVDGDQSAAPAVVVS